MREALRQSSGASQVASEGLESSVHAVSVDAALAVIEALEAQSEVRPCQGLVSGRANSQFGILPAVRPCKPQSWIGTYAALIME